MTDYSQHVPAGYRATFDAIIAGLAAAGVAGTGADVMALAVVSGMAAENGNRQAPYDAKPCECE